MVKNEFIGIPEMHYPYDKHPVLIINVIEGSKGRSIIYSTGTTGFKSLKEDRIRVTIQRKNGKEEYSCFSMNIKEIDYVELRSLIGKKASYFGKAKADDFNYFVNKVFGV